MTRARLQSFADESVADFFVAAGIKTAAERAGTGEARDLCPCPRASTNPFGCRERPELPEGTSEVPRRRAEEGQGAVRQSFEAGI